MNAPNYIREQLRLLSEAATALQRRADTIAEITKICTAALRTGHKIIFCGNGGSAAQSQHLAAELVGRYKKDRPALNSLSLTVDTSNITAIANDYGYDEIFARQLEGIGCAGDVLIGLSTSGNSPNVLAAFKQAQKMSIHTIALVGGDGGKMAAEAQTALVVPAETSAHIQELHIAAGHLICDLIETDIYG